MWQQILGAMMGNTPGGRILSMMGEQSQLEAQRAQGMQQIMQMIQGTPAKPEQKTLQYPAPIKGKEAHGPPEQKITPAQPAKPPTHEISSFSVGPTGTTTTATPLKMPSLEDLKVAWIMNQDDPKEQARAMKSLVYDGYDASTELEWRYFDSLYGGDKPGASQALAAITALKQSTQVPNEAAKEYAGFVARMNAEGYDQVAPPEDFKNKFQIQNRFYQIFGPDSGMLGLVQAMSPQEKLNTLGWWYTRKEQEQTGPRLFTEIELSKMEVNVLANLKMNKLIYGSFLQAVSEGASVPEAIKAAYPLAVIEQQAGGDPKVMGDLILTQQESLQASGEAAKSKAITDYDVPEQGTVSEAFEAIQKFLMDDWTD